MRRDDEVLAVASGRLGGLMNASMEVGADEMISNGSNAGRAVGKWTMVLPSVGKVASR